MTSQPHPSEPPAAAGPQAARRPVGALIFDFDGLLLDTETPAYESWRAIYAEHGRELPMELWKHALGTAHGFDALEHLAASIGPTLDREAVGERRMRLKLQLSESELLLPGVLAILDEAEALGLPRAVASSSDRAWVEGWLGRHGIAGRFGCVRTADDVRRTKPDPELFLSAAACLGVAPEACVVFEDSPNGILAARAAGMRCVAVPGAITRQIALPPVDLTLERLDALPLSAILVALGHTEGAAALAGERCAICRPGAPVVTPEEAAALAPLVPEWQVVERDGAPSLERSFRFASYAAAIAFVNRVAAAADEQDHHPTMLVTWRSVTVRWWTHAIRNLHRNDYIMAARTDELARS